MVCCVITLGCVRCSSFLLLVLGGQFAVSAVFWMVAVGFCFFVFKFVVCLLALLGV